MACIPRGLIAIHERVGHVFQERFKAIVVGKYAYLLELSREKLVPESESSPYIATLSAMNGKGQYSSKGRQRPPSRCP